jgi:hypothetical protein
LKNALKKIDETEYSARRLARAGHQRPLNVGEVRAIRERHAVEKEQSFRFFHGDAA